MGSTAEEEQPWVSRSLPKEPGHETSPFPNGKSLFQLFLTASPVLQISGRSHGTALCFGGAGSSLPARLLPTARTIRTSASESRAPWRPVTLNGSVTAEPPAQLESPPVTVPCPTAHHLPATATAGRSSCLLGRGYGTSSFISLKKYRRMKT